MKLCTLLFLGILISNIAFSAENAFVSLKEICTKTPIDDRFVVKLEKRDNNQISVRVCNIYDYRENGEECGENNNYDNNGNIDDINEDGYHDLQILYAFPGGLWVGPLPSNIYLNCQDGTFVRIIEGVGYICNFDLKNGMKPLIDIAASASFSESTNKYMYTIIKIFREFYLQTMQYKIVRQQDMGIMEEDVLWSKDGFPKLCQQTNNKKQAKSKKTH
jgi:hypothetical protein